MGTVKDYRTDDVFGIVLWSDQIMQDIYNKSGDLVTNNEFQVHYNAAVFEATMDNQYFYLVVPTVIYNYAQSVTSSSVSFELKEVSALAGKLQPLADQYTKIVQVSELTSYLVQVFGSSNLKITNTVMNNLHFHPGGLNRFSGTDYDTNINNPGICFPLSSANLTPIVSSIGLREPLRLAHTELRLAEGDTAKEMNYYKGKSITIVKGFTKEATSIEKILEISKSTKTYRVSDGLNHGQLIDDIEAIWDQMNYHPDTTFIKPENVTKEAAKSFFKYDNYTTWHNERKRATEPKKKEKKHNMLDMGLTMKDVEEWVSTSKVRELRNCLILDLDYEPDDLKGLKKTELQDIILENYEIALEADGRDNDLFSYSNYHLGEVW